MNEKDPKDVAAPPPAPVAAGGCALDAGFAWDVDFFWDGDPAPDCLVPAQKPVA